ncbi:hypothetical protein G7054_g7737 [Neopestalotiopsis clavispora]|nr:hypothetical protein G7054_g7737 [Neopestalotiopsis clavispora]
MTVSTAISALQDKFEATQVLLPGTESYEERNGSYLPRQVSDLKPAAIFQPRNNNDVLKFVQLMKPFALAGEANLAVRGAGNSPVPGATNMDHGITLDLMLLDEIALKDGIVSVGAGAHWSAVNEKVQAAGLGVAGGRSGTGGIGGLALAGGLSVFSSREGFVCDNVVNFEIVLASGDIVNANAQENPDLWIALKGGSNNFGVITRYDMATFKQGPFWGGNVLYFPPAFPGQIEALVTELQKPDADPNSHLMLSIGYSARIGAIMCMNTVYYAKEEENPKVLEPFVAMQPQVPQPGVPKMTSLVQMSASQAASVSNQVRCAYLNLTVKADVATLQDAANIYTEAIAPLKSCEGLTCSFTLQPYPVSLLQQSVARGGNSLGLDPVNGPLVSVLLLNYWQNSSDDERIMEVMKGGLEAIRSEAAEKGTAIDYIYLNYAAPFQNPIASYGFENESKLQAASQKYDPEGLFQKGFPGGFKIFR